MFNYKGVTPHHLLIQDDLIEGEILYYKGRYLLTHGKDIEIVNTENL